MHVPGPPSVTWFGVQVGTLSSPPRHPPSLTKPPEPEPDDEPELEPELDPEEEPELDPEDDPELEPPSLPLEVLGELELHAAIA